MFRRSFHFLKALLFLLGIFASANLSASSGEFDGKSRITRELSGLFAGDGGFDIHVGDATSLTGSVIHSEATPDQNRLVTGSLDVASLEDISKWSLETGSLSLSGSYNGGGTNGIGMGLPSSDGGDKTRTVASGISAGELIVENGMLPEIRRDTQALLAEEILDSLPDDLQQQLAEAQEIAAAAKEASASLARATGDVAGMLEARFQDQQVMAINEAYRRGELTAEEAAARLLKIPESNPWAENGVNRVLVHALTQGVIAGYAGGDAGSGLQGAGGVIAGSFGNQLAAAINETFGIQGVAADVLTNFFATAAGGLAGGSNGGFTAGSVDANNRQLHLSEIDWIRENLDAYAAQMGLSKEEAFMILTVAAYAQVDGTSAALVFREDKDYREKIEKAQAFLATNQSGHFKATYDEKFDNAGEELLYQKIILAKSDFEVRMLLGANIDSNRYQVENFFRNIDLSGLSEKDALAAGEKLGKIYEDYLEGLRLGSYSFVVDRESEGWWERDVLNLGGLFEKGHEMDWMQSMVFESPTFLYGGLLRPGTGQMANDILTSGAFRTSLEGDMAWWDRSLGTLDALNTIGNTASWGLAATGVGSLAQGGRATLAEGGKIALARYLAVTGGAVGGYIGLREGLGYALTSDTVGWSPEQASAAQTIFDAAAAVAAFRYASPGAETKNIGIVIGEGTALRKVDFSSGLRHALKKHITGSGPVSLKTLDPGGNTDQWIQHIIRTAQEGNGKVTKLPTGTLLEIMSDMPLKSGGTTPVGVRLFRANDSEVWKLNTLLTKP